MTRFKLINMDTGKEEFQVDDADVLKGINEAKDDGDALLAITEFLPDSVNVPFRNRFDIPLDE